MAQQTDEKKITIDGVEYNLDDISDKAKEHLLSIQFVDAKLQQLSNEWAVSDTARIGYTNALKAEFMKTEASD